MIFEHLGLINCFKNVVVTKEYETKDVIK